MRILLTGHTGLLGSELKKVFSERGHDIVLFAGRVEDARVVKEYCGTYDWIVHAGAQTSVDRCEIDRESCWHVNAMGTRNMRDIAALSAARFMYISTASVFSGIEGNYNESDRPYPQNFYNLSKFAGEIFASEYEKTTIIRLVVVGIHANGSRGKNFMEWLVDSFSSNKDMRLFNDVTINPLSSVTLADLIEKILVSPVHVPIAHLTSENRLSKAAIGKMVVKYFPDYCGTITECSSEIPGSAPHPKEMWLNSDVTVKKFKIKRPSIRSEIDVILRGRKKQPTGV